LQAKLSLKASLSRGDAGAAAATGEAGCVVCSTVDNPESILICDGCESEYHLECLQPPMAAVPEGDWFCATCRAVVLIYPKAELGMTWNPGAETNLDVHSFALEAKEMQAQQQQLQQVCTLLLLLLLLLHHPPHQPHRVDVTKASQHMHSIPHRMVDLGMPYSQTGQAGLPGYTLGAWRT
jgi:hypothetical protein